MKNEVYDWVHELDEEDLVNNYECIGEGSSRRVYAINSDAVVKFAKDEIGGQQNLTEWKVYNSANAEERDVLATVFELVGDGRMLVMGRAKPVNQVVDECYYEKMKRLILEFNLLEDDLIDDSSWGIYEDQLVCIDYGCTKEIRQEYDDTMLYSDEED